MRHSIINQLAKAGVTEVRIDVGWATMQWGGDGTYASWYETVLDNCVNWSVAAGITPMLMVQDTPPWANGCTTTAPCVTNPPSNPADFGNFMGWLAARYKGKVNAYEIWNEPNDIQTFFTPTQCQPNPTDACQAQYYTPLLKAAYQPIHSADSNALVVLGAPSLNDDVFISDVYAYGGEPYFDVMATHPYQQPAEIAPTTADSPPEIWNVGHIATIHNIMAAHGDGNKPFWFTEWGYSSHECPNTPCNSSSGWPNSTLGVSETQQATDLVQFVQMIHANYPYVKNMYWYEEMDFPDPPGASDGTIQNDHYGLLDSNLNPKPDYSALSSCRSARTC